MAIFGRKKQTIDLLPDKNAPKAGLKPLPIIIGAIAIIAIQVAAAAFLFFANLTTQNQVAEAKKQIQTQTQIWQQYAQLATTTKAISAKNAIYDKDVAAFAGLDIKLDKIRSLIPNGVTIDQISLNNKGTTTLNAHSANPADGYQLATVVQSNPNLKKVSLDGVTKSGTFYQFIITFLITGN